MVPVDGEIDLASAPKLMRALDDAVGGAEYVIADFSAATFIDSTAIATVVRSAQRLDPELSRLAVVFSPGSQPGRIWDLVGVSPPIPRFASRAAAEAGVLAAS